ncbi:hypothetical protein [Methanococcus voltae]|uniref:hypothetical protein n=1 Tax=Methanococcus voltae TaxID=2188 RepID=UPI001AE3B0BE|nr:hypothetical protein [Methanococcus voltae]MBP2173076.1 hypothetical protein [Methanococcus voltae]
MTKSLKECKKDLICEKVKYFQDNYDIPLSQYQISIVTGLNIYTIKAYIAELLDEKRLKKDKNIYYLVE